MPASEKLKQRAIQVVDRLLLEANIVETTTKAGWCLREGLLHVTQAHGGSLLDLVEASGAPEIYNSIKCRHQKSTSSASSDENSTTPDNSFQSLCRIIVGQQLGGAAAQAAWRRLNQVVEENLTPQQITRLADTGIVDHLQKPAGISGAKARALHDLASHFEQGLLSEDLLTANDSDQAVVRERLLDVKGVGPWSCDMFMMFHLERADVLPIGDLGVRKGLAKHFRLKGSAKNKALCAKTDVELMHDTALPFVPFTSLLTYYMWKAADTQDFYHDDGASKSEKPAKDVSSKSPTVSKRNNLSSTRKRTASRSSTTEESSRRRNRSRKGSTE